MKKILAAIRNNYSEIYKAFLFLVTMIILVSIFPSNKQFRYEFTEGRPWLYEDLIAPNDFSLKKTDVEFAAEISDIKENSTFYFKYDDELSQEESSQISARFDTIWLHDFGFGSREAYAYNKETCLNIGAKILETGFISIPNELIAQHEDKVIVVIRNKTAKDAFLNYFYNEQSIPKFIREELSQKSELESDFILSFLMETLKPNVLFDSTKTNLEKEVKLSQLSPNKGIILKDQHIISKGAIVDAETVKILESLRIDSDNLSRKSMIGIYIGKIILMSVPLITLGLYLFFFM